MLISFKTKSGSKYRLDIFIIEEKDKYDEEKRDMNFIQKLILEIKIKQIGFNQIQKLFGENYFGLYLLCFLIIVILSYLF